MQMFGEKFLGLEMFVEPAAGLVVLQHPHDCARETPSLRPLRWDDSPAAPALRGNEPLTFEFGQRGAKRGTSDLEFLAELALGQEVFTKVAPADGFPLYPRDPVTQRRLENRAQHLVNLYDQKTIFAKR